MVAKGGFTGHIGEVTSASDAQKWVLIEFDSKHCYAETKFGTPSLRKPKTKEKKVIAALQTEPFAKFANIRKILATSVA